MSHEDRLHRFLFENTHVRGEFVRLHEAWQEVQKRHACPPAVRVLLGEAMAATSLLSATIKFLGSIILQVQGNGAISLLVVQVDTHRGIRAMAEYSEPVEGETLPEVFGEGRLVITIEPEAGGERYQGIVELGEGGLAQALEGYFRRSEQLETRLWLAANDEYATGLMLQEMPKSATEALLEEDDTWNRVVTLANTIRDEEMYTLSVAEILRRLFHEEDVRLFNPELIHFQCSCTRERVESTLYQLGQDEVQQILEEQGKVSVDCSFCNQRYEFDAVDVERIFAKGFTPELPRTTH